MMTGVVLVVLGGLVAIGCVEVLVLVLAQTLERHPSPPH